MTTEYEINGALHVQGELLAQVQGSLGQTYLDVGPKINVVALIRVQSVLFF